MRMEHLEYLICLARTHSITKASTELFTTHQNVSKMIRQLEDELEATLFVRSQKGVYLTAEGEILLEFAQSTIEQLQNARLQLNTLRAQHDLAGDLYLYSGMSVLSNAFAEILKLFSASYPNINLHIQEAEPLVALQQSAQREHALALAPIMDCADYHFVYDPYLPQLKCYPLSADGFLCIISRSNPLAQLKSIPIKRFLQYPLALTQSDHFLKYIFKRYGDYTVGFSSNNTNLYLQALISGRFVGVTTEGIHEQRDHNDAFYQHVTVLPFSENLSFHNCLLEHPPQTPYPPQQAFIAYTQKHLALF